VQVAPALKPVTVVENDVASVAVPAAGEGVPLVQPTLTLALPLGLLGTKSLATVNVADRSVLVIVQVPAESEAEQAPLET
jgi:hypothetical protein